MKQAKDLKDPMRNFATLATIDKDGDPRLRTITKRNINDEFEFLFIINRHSPKAQNLLLNGKNEVLFLWPSILVQYRIRGNFEFVRDELFLQKWLEKSPLSRKADYYHEQDLKQSSKVDNYHLLKKKMTGHQVSESMLSIPPPSVCGLTLRPHYVEQWIGCDHDRIHNRRLFEKKEGKWNESVLVP